MEQTSETNQTRKTPTHTTITGDIRKRAKSYKRGLRLNDRIVMWAVDTLTRKTQQEIRKANFSGADPLI